MNKKCNKCGSIVSTDSKFCTNCGGSEFTEEAAVQPTVAPVQPTVAPVQPVTPVAGAQPPKKGMPTWLKVILIILLVLLLMAGCTVGCVVATGTALFNSVESGMNDLESELDDYDYDYDYDYDDNTDYDDDDDDTSTSTGIKTLGDTFTFDGFEITLGKDITYSVIENQFSEHNGKEAIRVSATIKNNNSETDSLSSLDYKFYGSKGTELSSVGYYFSEDSVTAAGELRSGASYEKAFYLIYDGDGKYAIEFDDWLDEELTVEFNVTK